MKPKIETVNRTKTRDSFAPRADHPFPLTDCNYHSVALGGYSNGCARAEVPSFLNISRDYFKNEARSMFATEAAFFSVIVVTAAVPLINTAMAMVHLVRSVAAV